VPSEVHSMRESVKHATERAAELHIVDGVGHLGSDRMNALMVAATDRFAPL